MIPAKYEEISGKMDNLLNITKYAEDIYYPSIAYTSTRTNNDSNTVYRIYVNNKDEVLSRFLYVHECGHIIFGHVKNMDLRMDQFLFSKIAVAYSKVAHYFPKYDEYLKVFRTAVFNIVMDFEVNSRLFTSEEWEFMNQRLEEFLEQKGSRGMWPQDYGYPPGLSWNEYLTLILLNPENFMKQFKIFLDNVCKDDGEVDDGPLSTEALRKLRKIEREHYEASFDFDNNNFYGKTGKAKYQAAEEYTDMKDLFKSVKKELEFNIPRLNHSDVLYNYNRRKHNSDVIIPKQITSNVIQAARLFILVDVSSSVPKELINGLINIFKECSSVYRKTVFVTWNTEFVDEWKISENIKLKTGGGTEIAPGISYVNERYSPNKKDVFLLLSDFCDCLEDWEKELLQVNAKKIAVNWNSIYSPNNPGFNKVFAYTGK